MLSERESHVSMNMQKWYRVQGDLVQGFIHFKNLGYASVFHVSVWCCETRPILRTHRY